MDYTSSGFDAVHRSFNLFRRCVECPSDTPDCPTCATGEVCTQFSATCDTCAYRTCIPIAQSGATNNNNNNNVHASSGPNVGAIVGGVIGGLAFIAIVTYLVWRFYLKDKKTDDEDYEFGDAAAYAEKDRRDSTARRAARASTHTVASVASTVMTRASNVIPIAFIPGITSRRDVDVDAPPVPTVPLHHQHSNPNSPYDSEHPGHNSFHSAFSRPESSHSSVSGWRSPYVDSPTDHYFMPHDLRMSSAFSATTVDSDRRSSVATSRFTRASLTPSLARGSIASTIYGPEVEPVAARTATRGRANVVSVHNSSRATPTGIVPEVPQIDYLKYGAAASEQAGPSASNNSTANKEAVASTESEDEASDQIGQLKVPSGKPKLSAAIEEATRRASRQPTHGGLGSIKARDPSPFSDEHEV